jgi:hypothetical protein
MPTNINVMSGSNSMFNLQHEINSVESSLVKLNQGPEKEDDEGHNNMLLDDEKRELDPHEVT